MLKFKLVLNSIALGLLMVGTNAYAACVTNTGNISTTLDSIGSGSCENAVGGVIDTVSDGGYGIYSLSSGSLNINIGSIVTNGNYSYGVFSTNTNNTNTNSGSIVTNGNHSYGIHSTASNNSNINTGSIVTSGIAASAIVSSGINNTNTNSRSITTNNNNSHGIRSSGIGSTNINTGSIETGNGIVDGFQSSGIFSDGANSTNINTGTITTYASSGHGIQSSRDNNSNSNSGHIITSGVGAHGIYSWGINSTIINSGTITTSGDTAYGIYSTGPNANNTNSGFIISTGANGRGVVLAGNNQTFTNSGLIMATGANSNAIRWAIGVSNGVVNLNRGSVIIGDMVAGDHENARLNINLGSGSSYAYSVSSHVLVSDLDNRPMVTGSAYAAGIGAQETASEMLYQRTSVITSALDRRLRSYASNEIDNQPYWLDVYYSDVTRNSGGNYSTQTAFSNYNYGVTAGFKLPAQFTPLELVVNVEQSNLNIDGGNQKIDSSSIMAGLLAPNLTDLLGAKLSAKVLVGYADHNGDRKVMTNSLLYDGSRQIKSDYNSNYAVLGTALTKLYSINDRLTADVVLGLDLNVQRTDSYKETDYFSWDSRILTQLHSRIQTGLDYKVWGDKGSVFARVGAEHRDLIGGATQDYSINGTNVSFNTNNKNDTYLTAQVGIKAQLEKRVHLFGVVNTLHSSDSVNSVSGNIGLRADF